MSEYLKTDYQKKLAEQRYAQKKSDGSMETIDEIFKRVSFGNQEYYNLMIEKKFLGAGRILANMGGTGNNMAGNCFAIPIEDSLESILKCQGDSVRVFAKGGGKGTNFSPLRPKDAPIQGAPAGSSGPCSFIDAQDVMAGTIKQGGKRRSASMSILDCDHPDIFEFVDVKSNPNRWNNTNVSIGCTDLFMQAVEDDDMWELKFNGKNYATVAARDLWNRICLRAVESGEPGVIFLDTINKAYPLRNLYTIKETNPCQPVDTLIWDVDRLRYITDQNAKSWKSWRTGLKEIVELETNTGLKIYCTPNHELILKGNSKVAAQYSLGKELMQPKDWKDLTTNNAEIIFNPNEVVRGFLFGDGYLCASKLGVSVKLNPVKEPEVASMLVEFGFHRQDSGAYYMGRKDVEKLINIDFLEYMVWERNLPADVILGQPHAFLRGLYAANGSCNKRHGQISFKTTNKTLAEHLQILLGSLSIHASVCENVPQTIQWPNGEYVSKKSYNVQTPTSYSSIFQDKIGFIAKAKRDNIKTSKINRVRIFVTGIHSLGREEVWDYQMTSSPHHNYCQGTILANCSEVPLLPNGMCLLGSLILSSFVKGSIFQEAEFTQAVRAAVRYLDEILDLTTYPTPEIEQVAENTRSIGLGVTAFADMLFLLKLPYGNYPQTLKFVDYLGELLYETAKDESEKLAEEKGAFPVYDSKIMDFPPRRNSILLAFAPSGTISGFIGCSYGIEPHFAPVIERNEDLGKDTVSNSVVADYMKEHSLTVFPEWTRFVGGASSEFLVTTEDHLAVLNVLARHCDSAISKTINLPQGSTAEDVSKVFMYCWKNSIKGITVYVDKSRKDQPISWDATKTTSIEESECTDDLEEEWDDGDIEIVEVFRSPKERPVGGLSATVYPLKFNPMQPTLWITISEFEDEPFELFFSINNNMYQELLDGLSRSVTSSWRRGEWLIHLFKDYCKYESTSGGSFFEYAPGKRTYIKSILHGVGLIVLEHFNLLGLLDAERILIPALNASAPVKEEQVASPPLKGNKCPNCGEYMVFKFTSCPTCQMCGYSECG